MSAPLEGKIALVTGASRGIGRAVALELAALGADVAVGARHPDPLRTVVEGIAAAGRRGLALGLDVSDPRSVEAAAESIEQALGRVSILVNNAGITRDTLLLRMKAEDWDEVLRVNLSGVFHCTRVFSRDMLRARWGRIINISSVVGVMGNAGQSNYAAAKAGILGFTRSVARELASRNVTANAVAPGFIDTAMTESLSAEVKETMLRSIPLGRFGQPEDVAAVVGFLAGERAAYVTGQVVHVDGGMVMA